MNQVDRAFIKAFSDHADESTVDQRSQKHPPAVSSREIDVAEVHSAGATHVVNGQSELLLKTTSSTRVPTPHSQFIQSAAQGALTALEEVSGVQERSTSFQKAATKRFDAAHRTTAADGHQRQRMPANAVSPPHFDRGIEPVTRSSQDVVLPPNAKPILSKETPRLHPAWEVDHYRWPTVCDRLNELQADHLTTAVQSMVRRSGGGDRVIAVVGSEKGVGCTTVTMCLAKQLARTHASVALLDANVEHPDLAKQLEVQVTVGWNDLHDGLLDLSEAAVASTEDSITVVPLRAPVQSRLNSICRKNAVDILSQLTQTFDLVLVDTGHAGQDVLGLFSAHTIEGIQIVYVRKSGVARGLDDAEPSPIQLTGLPVVGIAENFAA